MISHPLSVRAADVLSPRTCRIHAALASLSKRAHSSELGWAPLIIAVMYEYATGGSPWKEYIQALPPVGFLTHPHVWPAAQRKILLADFPHLLRDVQFDIEFVWNINMQRIFCLENRILTDRCKLSMQTLCFHSSKLIQLFSTKKVEFQPY